MAGAAGGGSPSSRATGYQYTKLADAMVLPQGLAQCHLFGVMTECTQPRPTRGTGARPCTHSHSHSYAVRCAAPRALALLLSLGAAR
jgi:hypothetical protein